MKRRKKQPTPERSWSDRTWRMLARRRGVLALTRFIQRRELNKMLRPSSQAEQQAVLALCSIKAEDVVGLLSAHDAYHLRALLLRTVRAVHLFQKLNPAK
ncbi:hypothetical protein LJ737_04325 [Hymenobacter sp. 15J16-1T3B]|uniref:hypothetical protein n=1 Tax=Hymenobacter sp. 15J16-1T3B TaxID=2886941 RepID=UPI001D12155D|nr:hypothetical protein [Hymenobacter sp. 15J16-1T3B]MCC3156449.1 hypothetical protein [Hymenobacter sp. 15J16-1T3B]